MEGDGCEEEIAQTIGNIAEDVHFLGKALWVVRRV